MKQLELKHLAGYLPYKLKCQVRGEGNLEFELQGISYCFFADLHRIEEIICDQYYFEDVFPILHPFSDFNKEIEHNGEKFVPRSKFIGNPLDYEILRNSYTVVQQLLEWHFDIHGLIEEGLAIDINTLKI